MQPRTTEVGVVLLPPVWEPFHGTLYHESILTLALPPAQHLPCTAFLDEYDQKRKVEGVMSKESQGLAWIRGPWVQM